MSDDLRSSATRRQFLGQTATGLAAAAAGMSVGGRAGQVLAGPQQQLHRLGKAEHCIMVWLGGGACQIDTWDPKRRGQPKQKKPGSYYDAIDTAVPGVQVCEHLPRCAKLMERFNLVRTVHHDVIDEHAAATNRMHTGRPTSGTIVYPSIGSVVAHQRGAADQGVPAYVLIGYPNVTRGPGFLGAQHSYIYLTDTQAGPAGLSRPENVTDARSERREQLLARQRRRYLERRRGYGAVANYDATLTEALRLAGPKFAGIFDLSDEPGRLRESYGGEFGQRCLLSRRLIQSGVRFIEVSHNLNFVNGTGWDVHNGGILNQHLLIREMDQALSALITDLENQKLLDKTLIVVSSEFGRPAQFDGGGGRGHHGKCFSVALAGGGLQNGKPIGVTDELGMQIVERPVSVPDLHATIYSALGIDPAEELFDGDRPVPITDRGRAVAELFA